MAKVKVTNLLSTPLNIPFPINYLLAAGRTKEFEVIDLDDVFNDPDFDKMRKKGWVRATRQEDDTPPGSPVLPFFEDGSRPAAADNQGMMLYNTTHEQVQLSDGLAWLGVETLLIISGGLPAPTSVPAGYLVWSKDDQALYLNGGSAWMLTQANGVQGLPGHVFPAPNSVPYGTMLVDTDTKQLRVSDQSRWLYPTYAAQYSSYSSLPLPTNVPFGNLAYTLDTQSLYTRVGGAWQTTAGSFQVYPTYADLPATYGSDEIGVVAYINDDRTMVTWDGKYWRYPVQMRDYKPVDLPDPANYSDGHMILNGDLYQPLIAWSGDWKGITPVARPYAAVVRPANADCKEGTMIWNTTSNQVNFNIGGNWVGPTGVVDP